MPSSEFCCVLIVNAERRGPEADEDIYARSHHRKLLNNESNEKDKHMSDKTRMATIDFRDEDIANNPITFFVTAHSSQKDGVYANPDGSSVPYSSYRWTQHDSTKADATFKPQIHGYVSAHDVTMINSGRHDVWAVVFKRKNNNYLEYLRSKPGFWRTLEKDLVKEICSDVIEAADLFDDETTTPLLIAASDKVIDAMFNKKDEHVIIANWVHYKGYDNEPSISFGIDKPGAHPPALIASDSRRVTVTSDHETRCDTERFGE